MTERCYQCGSANVRAISMEMTFAPLKAEPVYALAKPIVCLACGRVGGFLLWEEPLEKLRDSVLLQAGDPANGGSSPNSLSREGRLLKVMFEFVGETESAHAIARILGMCGHKHIAIQVHQGEMPMSVGRASRAREASPASAPVEERHV